MQSRNHVVTIACLPAVAWLLLPGYASAAPPATAEPPFRVLTGAEMRRELATMPPAAFWNNAHPRSNRATLLCVLWVRGAEGESGGGRAIVALDLKSRFPRAMVTMPGGWNDVQFFDHPILWREDSCLISPSPRKPGVAESVGPYHRWNVATGELSEFGLLTGDTSNDFKIGMFSQGAARSGLECAWRPPTAENSPGTIELLRSGDRAVVGKVSLSMTAQTISLVYCPPGIAVVVHRPDWPRPDSEFEVKATAVDDGRTIWRMSQTDLDKSFGGKVRSVQMAHNFVTSPDTIPCYIRRRVGLDYGTVLRWLDVRRGTWLPEISLIPDYSLPKSSANGRVVVISDRVLDRDILTEYRLDGGLTVTRIDAADKTLGTAHAVFSDGVVHSAGDARRLELISPFSALSTPLVLIDLDRNKE